MTPPREYARRYKEMLHITGQLPPGEKQPPSEKLALQWYYMTYHRLDRAKYVKSRKKLARETIKSLTEYFQSLFAQRKADGSLERAEIDRLCQRAKHKLVGSLCEHCDARRGKRARDELRERGRRGGDRSYRRIDDSMRLSRWKQSSRRKNWLSS